MLVVQQPVCIGECVDTALNPSLFFCREPGIQRNADIAIRSGIADSHYISDIETIEELVEANR